MHTHVIPSNLSFPFFVLPSFRPCVLVSKLGARNTGGEVGAKKYSKLGARNTGGELGAKKYSKLGARNTGGGLELEMLQDRSQNPF